MVEMATINLLPPLKPSSFPSSPSLSFSSPNLSPVFSRQSWRRGEDAGTTSFRTRRQAFRILANPNVAPGKGGSNTEVIMVDPLEAKRLATKQMNEIKAKEKFKRRCQIEAINGAWAMIGLTAGLVIEGQTGKSILTQLGDYFGAIINFI